MTLDIQNTTAVVLLLRSLLQLSSLVRQSGCLVNSRRLEFHPQMSIRITSISYKLKHFCSKILATSKHNTKWPIGRKWSSSKSRRRAPRLSRLRLSRPLSQACSPGCSPRRLGFPRPRRRPQLRRPLFNSRELQACRHFIRVSTASVRSNY